MKKTRKLTLKEQIDLRVHQAKDRKIWERAWSVTRKLGKRDYEHDCFDFRIEGVINISFFLDVDHTCRRKPIPRRVSISYRHNTVFSTGCGVAYYMVGETRIEVDSYKPGSWEKLLDVEILRRIRREEKEKARIKKQLKLQKEKASRIGKYRGKYQFIARKFDL